VNRLHVRVDEDGVDVTVALNESQTATELLAALPIESAAQTWGNEVYFTVPIEHDAQDPQATVEVGAVGYWPPGAAVCLFFGQQPVSPVNLIGRIEGDPSALAAVRDGHVVRLERTD